MKTNTAIAKDIITKTVSSLEEKGIKPFVVNNRAEALYKIKEMIPSGASVMNGSSRTLEQIGFVQLLKSASHSWNNLHETVLNEMDPIKQRSLRKQSVLSDYYVGSVHALTEKGEFVIGSNTGSQLPHIVFTSPNLIFVVGEQKIVKTLEDALERLENYVVPLEDKNMKTKYGVGTQLNKIVIFRGENPGLGRVVNVIIVKEELGF
ncbi:MAG: lactate utilization protein [Candidatus Woykebacteria bacterium]